MSLLLQVFTKEHLSGIKNAYMNFNCSCHALTALAGLVYVVGGYTDSDQSLLNFNAATNEIDVFPPMICPCTHFGFGCFCRKNFCHWWII